MSKARDRESFVAEMTRYGCPLHVIRQLMRAGTALHRLAEAQCNGDWPADNGERETKPCCGCDSRWSPGALSSVLRGVKCNGHDGAVPCAYARHCPDCRTTARVQGILNPSPVTRIGGHAVQAHDRIPRAEHRWAYQPDGESPRFAPKFGGDPRGAVLRIRVLDAEDKWVREEGIAVP